MALPTVWNILEGKAALVEWSDDLDGSTSEAYAKVRRGWEGSTAMTGKLLYEPPLEHKCDPWRNAGTHRRGSIWQCDCGLYWRAKYLGTSGDLVWTSHRQRHIKRLAERHQGTLKKGMASGRGPAPRVSYPPPYNPNKNPITGIESGQE